MSERQVRKYRLDPGTVERLDLLQLMLRTTDGRTYTYSDLIDRSVALFFDAARDRLEEEGGLDRVSQRIEELSSETQRSLCTGSHYSPSNHTAI